MKLQKEYPGIPLCVAGDFNECLSPPFQYGTLEGRQKLHEALQANHLTLLTTGVGVDYCIDHICLSQAWAQHSVPTSTHQWQVYLEDNKPASDHAGISIELRFN